MADRHILDAAAVLCLLDDEPGADRIAAVLDNASISSVSVALVAAELTRRGAGPQEVVAVLRELHLTVIPFGFDQALDTGTLGVKQSDEDATLEHLVCVTLAMKTDATGVMGNAVDTRSGPASEDAGPGRPA